MQKENKELRGYLDKLDALESIEQRKQSEIDILEKVSAMKKEEIKSEVKEQAKFAKTHNLASGSVFMKNMREEVEYARTKNRELRTRIKELKKAKTVK